MVPLSGEELLYARLRVQSRGDGVISRQGGKQKAKTACIRSWRSSPATRATSAISTVSDLCLAYSRSCSPIGSLNGFLQGEKHHDEIHLLSFRGSLFRESKDIQQTTMITAVPTQLPGASANTLFNTIPTLEDPYRYQVGFGNLFATEAIPSTLPLACNTPQRCKYDLFSEQLNGTPFVSSRASLLNTWFYRIRPSVAHRPLGPSQKNPDVEAFFSPMNPNTEFTPDDMSWGKFKLPAETESIDFVQGMKTIGGHGDPTIKEGLAVHIYAANESMENKAFCNNDGDFLIIPQQGRLDIQTEYGHLMVRPGELVVIQAGMRFRVALPDGPVRGYIHEIFGSHYELPELGPLGANGMALPRNFEVPVASFDIDLSRWEVVVKLAGQHFVYKQSHTPFDVVAWHGNYAPYKYAMEKFINACTVTRDQSDPSIYCVLAAKSKIKGVALSDFLVFTPKWSTTTDTFRPPYYHRNVCTELMGMVYGQWAGSATALEPGGLT